MAESRIHHLHKTLDSAKTSDIFKPLGNVYRKIPAFQFILLLYSSGIVSSRILLVMQTILL